ncbi:MAG: hypothetical protein QNK23_10675 [Crocinitomicaceae bacterium]|nr:hypothetical protein [Crocinitomicaceae bacterium]
MKFKTLLLAAFALLTIGVNAQDWSTDTYKYGEQYEGYIIDAEGNKIEGYIKYRNRVIMQEEVIFYKVKDNPSTKKKYLASNLTEYKVGDKLYHCINYSGGQGRQTQGNLVVNGEGCIKQYVWYTMSSGYNTLKKHDGESDEDFGNRKFPSNRVYYKFGDEIAVDNAYFEADFAKNLSKYLAENKVLAKKVKTKQGGYTKILNLRSIFDEFNKDCPEH